MTAPTRPSAVRRAADRQRTRALLDRIVAAGHDDVAALRAIVDAMIEQPWWPALRVRGTVIGNVEFMQWSGARLADLLLAISFPTWQAHEALQLVDGRLHSQPQGRAHPAEPVEYALRFDADLRSATRELVRQVLREDEANTAAVRRVTQVRIGRRRAATDAIDRIEPSSEMARAVRELSRGAMQAPFYCDEDWIVAFLMRARELSWTRGAPWARPASLRLRRR